MEYRLTWSASSDIGFTGATEWMTWPSEDEDHEQIEEDLIRGEIPEGLSEVLEASGFEWNVETRPKQEG